MSPSMNPHTSTSTNPFFLTHDELREAAKVFAASYPDRAKKAVEVAEHAGRNEFRLPFTMAMDRWVDMGTPIDWLYNPTQDLEFTWILNRHWHMEDLGKAYLLTGREEYVHTFARHFEEWLVQNSPPAEVPYEEATYFQRPGPWRLLETGLRVQSWIWTYRMVESSPRLSDSFRERFFSALAEHADYLVRFLGSAEINHAIMHMQSLFMIGAFHAEHPRSPLWRQLAAERLELCMARQVGDEGVQSELTTHYHNGSIGMFGTPYLLALKTGFEFPEEYGRKLARMGAFTEAAIRPDGQATPIGDSDWISHGRKPLGLLGAILGDKALLAAGEVSEELLWHFGADVYLQMRDSQAAFSPGTVSRAFEQTGYYFVKSEGQHLFFDAAGMGGAHGHADALSLEWMWRGQLIFADPGRYTYEEGEWRHYFKSTRAHNTVTVDGQDQTPYVATQRWGEPVAECETLRWIDNPSFAFLEATHDGYLRLEAPVLHRRWTLLGKEAGVLVIVDWLEGDGERTLEQRFQLHPDASVELGGSEDGASPSARIGYPSTEVLVDLHWTTAGSGFVVSEEAGWISRIYGEKEPNRVLSMSGTANGTTGIACVALPQLAAGGAPAARLEELSIDAERRSATVVYSTAGRTIRIAIDRADVKWAIEQ
ncbi:alginate lyase family protein [Cohnella fermenti]|uniref:Heparinase n=1 Tax=Cohnella fermenti TaxID=2565925 RepID=A0A4S4BM78_9BACL|nr:alginate lyase family protein [Cohnella fermenti]THF75347.1 heparinase [Cohnella fermenti]